MYQAIYKLRNIIETIQKCQPLGWHFLEWLIIVKNHRLEQ